MSREDRAALLRRLICAVVDAEESEVQRLLHRATRTLKDFKGPRVNQFAVQDRINGLVERAEILKRDDLGNALALRVANTNAFHNKFMPEYLTLLLELSDSPIEKADLQDLDRIKDVIANEQPSWEDILRHDPLDNADGLWDNVDFAGDGSSDEDELSLDSEPTDDSVDLTSLSLHRHIENENRRYDTDQAAQDMEALEVLRSEWTTIKTRTGKGKSSISELQIVREIIFMLRGYNTDLFETSRGKTDPIANVELQNLSQKLLQNILEQCSILGRRLSILRGQAKIQATAHVLQTYQFCLSTELHTLDVALSETESRCLGSSGQHPTLLELLSDVRVLCKRLLPLCEIWEQGKNDATQEIDLLESLFSLACSQQAVGDTEAFALTAKIFCKCFHMYLRPIDDWIFRTGPDRNDSVSFIQDREEPNQHHDTRSLAVEIVRDGENQPRAPVFLRPFVATIVNTGKSLKFLRALGKETGQQISAAFQLGQLSDNNHHSAFTPFSEQFQQSFEHWLKPIYEHATGALSETLRLECGLQRTLRALHEVFLGQNGPALDLVADAVLEKNSRSPSQLVDPAVLTGIYQEAFAASESVFEELISVRTQRLTSQSQRGASLGALLSSTEASYKLPWSVSKVVLPVSIDSYRRIHVLLLQLRVAKRAIDEKFHQRMIHRGTAHDSMSIQALRLSHRLRWFVHTLESYFLGVAIRDALPPFLQKINDAGDLDFKITAHESFVLTIQKRLLLSESAATAHQAVNSILDLIVKAASYLQRQWTSAHFPTSKRSTESSKHDSLDDSVASLSDMEESMERLKNFEAAYMKFSGFLLAGVQECSRLEGDKCLQILAESLALGAPIQASTG